MTSKEAGPLLPCCPSSVLQATRARSHMTIAGLPFLCPCTCLGLKGGGRWVEHSASPAQGGRLPGAGAGTQAPHSHMLLSHCPFFQFVRSPRHPPCQELGAKTKLPNFFPTWPSFVLADGRGPFSRHISEGGMGSLPTFQPTPDNYTQAHSWKRGSRLGQPGKQGHANPIQLSPATQLSLAL